MYNAVASALRSGHRMQSYGIKIRFLSGCSAGVARVVRYAEAGGSNPLTPTNYLLNSSNIWLYLLMLWLKRSASVPISRSQQKTPISKTGAFQFPKSARKVHRPISPNDLCCYSSAPSLSSGSSKTKMVTAQHCPTCGFGPVTCSLGAVVETDTTLDPRSKASFTCR